MNGLFSGDNPVINFLTVVCDIVILHFLWIITSLPIITIGASTTALYYTCMKCIRYGEGSIAKRYFKSFKENLKQSTVLWLIVLVAGGICGFDLYFSIINHIKALTLIFTVMTCAYLFIVFYVFPLQAQFDNKIKVTIRNAFLLAIKYFPWTLLLIAGTGAFLFLCYANIYVMGASVFIGIGLHAYLCSFVYVHVFKNYLPEEIDKDDYSFHIDVPDAEGEADVAASSDDSVSSNAAEDSDDPTGSDASENSDDPANSDAAAGSDSSTGSYAPASSDSSAGSDVSASSDSSVSGNAASSAPHKLSIAEKIASVSNYADNNDETEDE